MAGEDGDIQRQLTKISTANSDGVDAAMPAGGGWQQLKDEKTTTRLSRVGSSDKRGSENEVAIEMELAPTTRSLGRGAGNGTDGAQLDVDGTDVDEGTTASVAAAERVYKVYKRRWFGLVQLTLLNIIASWDVSRRAFFFPPLLCSWLGGWFASGDVFDWGPLTGGWWSTVVKVPPYAGPRGVRSGSPPPGSPLRPDSGAVRVGPMACFEIRGLMYQ